VRIATPICDYFQKTESTSNGVAGTVEQRHYVEPDIACGRLIASFDNLTPGVSDRVVVRSMHTLPKLRRLSAGAHSDRPREL
jgi:hypothetical protein